jgi:hypothetical protein
LPGRAVLRRELTLHLAECVCTWSRNCVGISDIVLVHESCSKVSTVSAETCCFSK